MSFQSCEGLGSRSSSIVILRESSPDPEGGLSIAGSWRQDQNSEHTKCVDERS